MRIIRFRGIKRFLKYHIDISYVTQVELTERTIATAEAFGLGIDGEQRFTICNEEIDINQKDVVYITGDSGSGKSSILREFKKIFAAEVADINELEIITDKPLIDTIGATMEEALQILSFVGLNDAFLFLRKFRELSDGQKYRYRLAKLINGGKKVWVCDEFCSTLDRDTAKIVSWNVQKIARKLGITLLVATCNLDLDEDLNANVRIDKRYGSEIKIAYNPSSTPRECSLMREITFQEGAMADWKALAQFHYRSHNVAAPRKFFSLRRGQELCGVVVYAAGPINTFGRKRFFGKVLPIREVNEKLSIINRVVIHPKYRTTGLGQRIIRESLPFAPTRYTETIAVMARYNPFFEKAGMLRVSEKEIELKVLNFLVKLKNIGFDTQYVTSRSYTQKFFTAHPGSLDTIKQMMCLFHHVSYNKIIGHRMVITEYRAWIKAASAEQIANLMHHIGVMATNKVYLIFDKEWLQHPELRKLPEIIMPQVKRVERDDLINCAYAGGCAYKGADNSCARKKGGCRDQK